ncbi:MAG: acyl carrier protein [Lachnospiraceae bacterium]|nr:acyl carrier protein [Lachnospiraceae bacterium]
MTEKILALIEEILKVPEGTITIDTEACDIEEWDSLAHVMIIGELEDKLGISIPLDEAVEITSVRELLEKAGIQ